MARKTFPKPFDGAISRFYEQDAPEELRAAILSGARGDILDDSFPYSEKMKRKAYTADLHELQIELVKVQSWAKETGARVVIVFEGRDAAGKGGTIKRFREFLNPRTAKVVALPKPTDEEASQWYFQRYVENMPSAGQIVLFDRSWYNRGVVEHVFGFCTPEQRRSFFDQVNDFEHMLTDDGIVLVKLWLNVGRAEQLRRFLAREADRLKQWKLSPIDVKGLYKWDDYTDAIRETFHRTHSAHAPWHIIRSDDKKRARLAAIRTVLEHLDYPSKDTEVASAPDARITGGPDMLHG